MSTNKAPVKLSVNWVLLAWMLGCLLFALAFLLPYQAGDWPGFYKQMLAVFGLGFWVLAVRPKRWHGFSLCMLLLALSAVLQYAMGLINFFDDAFLSVAYLFMLLLAFEVGVGLRRGDDGISQGVSLFDSFWWTLLSVSLLSVLIAFHQWLGTVNLVFEFPLEGRRPYANLAQPNHLSSLLALGICAVLFLYQRNSFAGWVAGLMVAFMLVAMALTVSRVAWLLVLVAGLYLLWKGKRKESRVPLEWVCFFCLFFLASLFATEYVTQELQLSQMSIGARIDAGDMNRLRLWSGLLTAVLDGPWYGYGWMQVATAALVSAAPAYGEYFNFSHSLLLDVLLWLGPWLGMVVIALSAVWLLGHFFRSTDQGETWCWLAFGALLLHALVEFPFAYTYFLVPAGLILGWAVGNSHQWVLVKARLGGRRLALVCVALLFLGAARLVSEYSTLVTSRFNDEMRQAKIMSFPQVDLSSVALLDSLRARQKVARFPTNGKLTQAQTQLLERVASRFPNGLNLLLLEKAYIWKKDIIGVCHVVAVVGKLYDNSSFIKAQRLAMQVVNPHSCKGPMSNLSNPQARFYPLVF